MGEISLYSDCWQERDVDGVTGCFIKSGFRNTGEILSARLFDLLNIDRLDSRRVEEMLMALYRWYSADPSADEEMALGIREQDCCYGRWRREHKDLSEVTAGDIVMAEDINRKAVLHFFGLVARAFYRSCEYDSAEYKYFDYESLKRRKENE